MNIETEFLRKYLNILILQLAVWGLPLLWVALIPPKDHSFNAEQLNEANIERIRKVILQFENEYRSLPESMTELKAYSYAGDYNAKFYDAFGNPLEYIHLSNSNYIIRSFGRDGTQNTLLQERDSAGSRLKKIPQETPKHTYSVGPTLSVYPAVLVNGSNSPQGQWFARIFANFNDGKKRLAVYHRRKRTFFMIARHDSVEEFLWLPSGYGLIYTASSSQRYRDGVYYWDLLEDEELNLLSSGSFAVNMPLSSKTHSEFMLSLAGLEIDGRSVYFYLVNKRYGESVNPYDFYSSHSLVRASIPINRNDKIIVSPALPDISTSLFENESVTDNQDVSPSLSLRIQHEWTKLALTGDLYAQIERWQDFVQRYPKAALAPYALYHITNLYHTAYSQNSSQSDAELAQLRGYAAEMAKALAEHPLAPSYLKALARYSYEQVIKGEPITFDLNLLK